MLGPPKSRRLDAPIAVSLETLVPDDHFYRHLEAERDLGFVREWARELYAEQGRPSIDPVVFFTLQLVMFCEGMRSEHQLIAAASLNFAQWVEPRFAEAKLWNGLRRLRRRGLANVNIEGLLTAAGQNLKRLLAATGWGWRHAPCGSLVALPRALQGLSAVPG
jgi:hypothetical protein